jgi:membrane protease subunit (stomatin/prohibitin family)
MEIQYGAQLTVRESQMAVFVNEGQVADVFGPGRYTLTTRTLPVLTYLKNWDKLFESPFKSEVYFLSTRLQLDCKWGTAESDHHPRPGLRHGAHARLRHLRVPAESTPAVPQRGFGYARAIHGGRSRWPVAQPGDQFDDRPVRRIGRAFHRHGGQPGRVEPGPARLAGAVFERYGLALDSFVVQNISLPEELQKILDTRIGMNMIGDLGRYTQYQVASSIPLAAQNESGIAGIGAGLGAGSGHWPDDDRGDDAGLPATAVQPAAAPVERADEVVAALEKLHGLVAKGIVSQAEFDARKTEWLGKLF